MTKKSKITKTLASLIEKIEPRPNLEKLGIDPVVGWLKGKWVPLDGVMQNRFSDISAFLEECYGLDSFQYQKAEELMKQAMAASPGADREASYYRLLGHLSSALEGLEKGKLPKKDASKQKRPPQKAALQHDDTFRKFTLNGKKYHLGWKQAKAIKFLHDNSPNAFRESQVTNEANTPQKLQQLFRNRSGRNEKSRIVYDKLVTRDDEGKLRFAFEHCPICDK